MNKDFSMGVSLEPEQHVYSKGRLVIPSVSEILRPYSSQYYGEINKKKLEAAAKRGREVHRAIEDEKEFGFSISGAEYVQAYKAWQEGQADYTPLMTEQIITHRAMIYAGTVDEVCWLNHRLTIMDYKTSAQKCTALWALQLTAYKMAYLSHLAYNSVPNGEPDICVLWLHEGKAELVPLVSREAIFSAVLKVHAYMRETNV